MPSYTSDQQQPSSLMKTTSWSQADTVSNTVAGFMVIFFPSCLILGIFLYKRYQAYRTTVLYQQIETLERLWRISPKQ